MILMMDTLNIKMAMYCIIAILAFMVKMYTGLTQEGCDEGWTFFSQSCYQFVPQGYDFDAAKGICMAKSSYLASVWETDEFKFITDTLWHSIPRNKMTWLGLFHRPDRNKGFMWVDGSFYDKKPKETPMDKFNCGGLTGDGDLKFIPCTKVLAAFVCKKALDMTYIVSDAFNTTHPQGMFTAEPERLLFERVWPPKLQTVPQYVSIITTTQVPHETDCAYKCFHVDYCRAFTLRCLLYTKCKSFSCDLFSPRYISET